MDRARLRALLDNHDLAWIIERARARLQRGETLTGTIRLSEPSAAQREALRRMLGLGQLRGEGIAVRLEELDALLVQAQICSGLAEAVVELMGPVSNLRQTRREATAAWEQLFAEQRARWEPLRDHPGLLTWLESLRMKGVLLRITGGDVHRARDLLAALGRLIAALPARLTTRSELAARLFADAHALDDDQVLGRLGLQAAAAWAGLEPVERADGRREVWERVGVLVDTLSAPLLVFNLRAEMDSVAGRLLGLHAGSQEPARLSARCLLRQPPTFTTAMTGRSVFACENPSIVAAAADRLGERCAPLLCTEGQPRTAAHLVLRALHEAGITIRYHGDFDWPGVAITNLLIDRHGVRPWRMAAADFLAAPPGTALQGSPVVPRWDSELGAAMQQRGCAVHEEQILELLLADLDNTRSR
jgi:uncharacterized protein (TIGR02679 family)